MLHGGDGNWWSLLFFVHHLADNIWQAFISLFTMPAIIKILCHSLIMENHMMLHVGECNWWSASISRVWVLSCRGLNMLVALYFLKLYWCTNFKWQVQFDHMNNSYIMKCLSVESLDSSKLQTHISSGRPCCKLFVALMNTNWQTRVFFLNLLNSDLQGTFNVTKRSCWITMHWSLMFNGITNISCTRLFRFCCRLEFPKFGSMTEFGAMGLL